MQGRAARADDVQPGTRETHIARALSGPPSTWAAIAMDGGVADTACYYTGR